MDSNELRKLAGPAYLAGVLMVVITLIDLGSNMIPVRLGDPAWRYGTIGLGSGFLMTPLLGMLVMALVALAAGHGTMGKILGWTNLAFAVLLLPLAGLFLLDAITVRGAVQPDSITTFDVGVAKAVIKLVAGVVAFGWLGWNAIRMKPRSRREAGGAGLMRQPS